ncbi:C40 family peptidase [Bacillus massilinigeriensis]|uniref:C40 family peptidase n=1 Tax=Bacillus massilionigeriensis TaxID=1805475 RepID=UPI00096B5A37|nr:C40 family peptidase [Bacillus massilionigeriensis]
MKKIFITCLISFGILFSGLFGSLTTEASSFGKAAVQVAKEQIGVRYKTGGFSPAGFDCSGLVGYSFKKAGKSIPRTASAIFHTGKKVSKKNLRTGDLVFFNTNGVSVSHVGIYIGKNKFVHSASNGVRIDSLSHVYWKPRYVGAKRI